MKTEKRRWGGGVMVVMGGLVGNKDGVNEGKKVDERWEDG